MKNSEDTIRLFNSVMDDIDSLTNEEFFKKFNESENGDITNLFLDAGYFIKKELETQETYTYSNWRQAYLGGIYIPGNDPFPRTQKNSIDMDYLYSLIKIGEIDFNPGNQNQSEYSGCEQCPIAA